MEPAKLLEPGLHLKLSQEIEVGASNFCETSKICGARETGGAREIRGASQTWGASKTRGGCETGEPARLLVKVKDRRDAS